MEEMAGWLERVAGWLAAAGAVGIAVSVEADAFEAVVEADAFEAVVAPTCTQRAAVLAAS